MTICIAAIGKGEDGKEIIVFATDHMVSNPLMGQFELPICKYKGLANNMVAMLAGDPLIFDKLIEKCLPNDTYEQTKNKIQNNMNALRSELIKKQYLDIFQMDYKYLHQVLQAPIQNAYIGSIIDSIAKFNLNTIILLIGFKEEEAQITEITDIKDANLRCINFSAIGSGSMQAMNTLLFQCHSKDDPLSTCVYNVYKAKRNAEVAIGVGKETDLFVLTQSKLYKIDQQIMQMLSGIYEKELQLGKTDENLKKALKELQVV
jgi:hypothetical protein